MAGCLASTRARRLEQYDAVGALALAPWLQQQPNVIELRVAALEVAGQTDALAIERPHLQRLKNAPKLMMDPTMLAAPADVATPAAGSNAIFR